MDKKKYKKPEINEKNLDFILISKTILISSFYLNDRYFKDWDDHIVNLAVKSFGQRDIYKTMDKIFSEQAKYDTMLHIKEISDAFLDNLKPGRKELLRNYSLKLKYGNVGLDPFYRNEFRSMNVVYHSFMNYLIKNGYDYPSLKSLVHKTGLFNYYYNKIRKRQHNDFIKF